MSNRVFPLVVIAALIGASACSTEPIPDEASHAGELGRWSRPAISTRYSFVPDWSFTGSTLEDWGVIGQADWSASEGELVGTPTSPDGGWLMLDRSLQDLELGFDFRASPGARAGVLLRAEQTSNGFKGVYVSLTRDDLAAYALTLDADGRERTREPLRSGGGMSRTAPPPPPAGSGGGGGGGGGQGGPPPVTLERPDMTEGPSGYREDDWNDINVAVDGTILRFWLNMGGPGASGSGAADQELGDFGPVALYVGGAGEVRFRDVSYKDLNLKEVPPEELSPNFEIRRLSPFYYSFAAAAADFNRNGHMDIVSGPFIFYGPDFTTKREIYLAVPAPPGVSFTSNWLQFAGDFTGNGWPDVLLASTSGTVLYVNPEGEARRWDSYTNVIPPGPTLAEVTAMKDVDGDGVPDLVYMSGGAIRWGKPDPENPTGPWLSTQVGEPGSYVAHGIGAGDINGNGLTDILNTYGWWENPGEADTPMWTYHPVPFGRQTGRGSAGGAEMCVYDVNGNGLNDVVTVLQAHGFGTAWFEQQRDAEGNISFVRHMITDNFATENAGRVTISQPHGTACADMDGDGVTDFVVGKRYYSHLESTMDPDTYGAPVVYVFRTVRDANAPGGAAFVPELVHNASGAGSQIVALDLNGNGINDIVTAGKLGVFAFFGQPRTGAGDR